MNQRLRFAPVFLFIGLLSVPSSLRAQADAENIFKKDCTLCHAPDGSGNTSSGKAFKVPDLRSDVVQKTVRRPDLRCNRARQKQNARI